MLLRRLAVPAALTALLAAGCDQAPTTAPTPTSSPSFVRNGALAGSRYPAVVLILAEVDGKPAFRCSGTLITPTVVLTAGHCVTDEGGVTGIRVFLESAVQGGANNYPNAGPNTVEATEWAAHPQYDPNAFYLHDVGVIRLSQPVNLPDGSYGVLPTVNQLDALRPRASTTFTSVGYGLQYVNPAKVLGVRVRMVAEPRLVQINTPVTGTYSLLLSSNANTGGTCFGDSGGPNYIGTSNVIAGVTSYARNGLCTNGGGVFRLDRPDVLAFVNGFVNAQ